MVGQDEGLQERGDGLSIIVHENYKGSIFVRVWE